MRSSYFDENHGQCPICGRWVILGQGGPWDVEFGCCPYCAKVLPIGQPGEVEGRVVAHKPGQRPASLGCEVTGKRFTMLSSYFDEHHAQCRLCGRWVYVADGNRSAWSYELACCEPCAAMVETYRRTAKKGGENE